MRKTPKEEIRAYRKAGKDNADLGLDSVRVPNPNKKGYMARHLKLSSGHFHNPAVAIAKEINDALNPDNKIYEGKTVEGPSGASGVIVALGEILPDVSELGHQYARLVQVYGKKIWLKTGWVKELPEGRVEIVAHAFVRNKYLKWARKQHLERKATLMKRFQGGRDG